MSMHDEPHGARDTAAQAAVIPPPLAHRLPPGQRLVDKLPEEQHGAVPEIDLSSWRLSLFGLVENRIELDLRALLALGSEKSSSDAHCAMGWSKLDNRWEGLPALDVLRQVSLLPETRFCMVHAADDWTTNLSLADLRRPDVLFAFRLDGRDLSPGHGFPLRLVVPHLYFWKSAKWVTGLEFTVDYRPGFWEKIGHHMHGDPWYEERYREGYHPDGQS